VTGPVTRVSLQPAGEHRRSDPPRTTGPGGEVDVEPDGTATLPVALTSSLGSGQLFATFHDPTEFLNAISGPQRDSVVGAPEHKVTGVRLERPALS